MERDYRNRREQIPIGLYAEIASLVSSKRKVLTALHQAIGDELIPHGSNSYVRENPAQLLLFPLREEKYEAIRRTAIELLLKSFFETVPSNANLLPDWQERGRRIIALLQKHGFDYEPNGAISHFEDFESLRRVNSGEANWANNHLRIFLSHTSKFKDFASKLSQALEPYCLSSFVAHSSVRPLTEWRREILHALKTMDVLVAILTPEFAESKWTAHEVGVGIGREIPVVPIEYGLSPFGLIENVQCIPCEERDVNELASDIFDAIIRTKQGKDRLATCLVARFLNSTNQNGRLDALVLLKKIKQPSRTILQWLRLESTRIKQLPADVFSQLNEIMEENEMIPAVDDWKDLDELKDDEVPF